MDALTVCFSFKKVLADWNSAGAMSSREKRERAAPQRFETGFKVSEPVAVAAGAGTALQDIEASCVRSVRSAAVGGHCVCLFVSDQNRRSVVGGALCVCFVSDQNLVRRCAGKHQGTRA